MRLFIETQKLRTSFCTNQSISHQSLDKLKVSNDQEISCILRVWLRVFFNPTAKCVTESDYHILQEYSDEIKLCR